MLDRLLALTTLLEGHADHVMDAVGPDVVPERGDHPGPVHRPPPRRRAGRPDAARAARRGGQGRASTRWASAFTAHVVRPSAWTGSTRCGRRRRPCRPGPRSPSPAPGCAASLAVTSCRPPARDPAAAGRGPARGAADRAGRRCAGRRAGAAARRCGRPAPGGCRTRCAAAPLARRSRLAAADAAGPVHAAVVDHGLQDGSARARRGRRRAARRLRVRAAGVHRVEVTGPGGLEAAARRARYAALRAARPHPDSRCCSATPSTTRPRPCCSGSAGAPGRARWPGWPAGDPPWLRPLLGVRRADHPGRLRRRAACRSWDDPHNADPRFTRVRLRREVLPLLEEVLAAASPRRWPAPRPSSARTPRRWTRWPTALLADRPATAAGRCRRGRRWPARAAGGAPAGAARAGCSTPAVPRRHRRPARARRRRSRDRPPIGSGSRAAGRLGAGARAWQAHACARARLVDSRRPCPERTATVYDGDIASTLVTEQAIREQDRASWPSGSASDYAELCADGSDLLLICVLKGAVMFMTDLARALPIRSSWSSWRSAPTARRPVVRGGAHPQGPGPGHRRPARADRRGHHRLRADPVLAAEEPGSARARRRSTCARCCASRTRSRSRSRCATSASTSPTSSSSATAWTTPSATATCRSSALLDPAVYA